MPKMSIALCLIAKNEEHNIRRLYDSVKGLFDEIHLTDTGSTDNTVEVAKELGMTVHHFEWCDDFSKARNFSMSHAKSDYLAWLDLDDVLENREGFLSWKENVMPLADYWVATYHYSSDDKGNPVCSFARERVWRRDKDLSWKYPIHEGVTPSSPHSPVRADFTKSWCVKHMRSESDLKQDRSRNVSILSKMEQVGKLDARMKYYYGKELFENEEPIRAITQLEAALVDKSLELHDRILAYQYLCYAYITCNQFDKAIQFALTAIQLDPQRAEFYGIIGDSYLKKGQLQNAVPFYSAAKNCKINSAPGMVGAIFHHKDSYGIYPSAQLARIYANLSQFDEAEKESSQALDKFPGNGELSAILTETKKVKELAFGFKNAKDCDDIVFSCMPSPYDWDGNIAKVKSMGGSETACIEMAKWLKKLSGRNVIVFNHKKYDSECDGVEYLQGTNMAQYFSKNKPYLHIAWRHNFKLTDAKTFVWSHDLQTPGVENMNQYEKVMCLTPFHKDYMMLTQGVREDKIYVTRNGIIPDRFRDGPWQKDRFRFVFGSSPDRGLERCIRVLDKVREVHPEVTLHIHYGWGHLGKYGLQPLADRLQQMYEERKSWITYHGPTQQDKLMESYKASSYCVQPSDWIETSAITAMELLACGVYPIFRKVGGVVDTLRDAEHFGMATLVDSECITECDYQNYVDATLLALSENKQSHVNIDVDKYSWELVAKQWLEDLPNLGVLEKTG